MRHAHGSSERNMSLMASVIELYYTFNKLLGHSRENGNLPYILSNILLAYTR